MAAYDPSPADEAASQQAKLRTKAITLLKAEGLQPSTPPEVLDEMIRAVDPADLAGSLAAVKAKWPMHFGPVRSADKIAARALGATTA